jgi:hypothetical protein
MHVLAGAHFPGAIICAISADARYAAFPAKVKLAL